MLYHNLDYSQYTGLWFGSAVVQMNDIVTLNTEEITESQMLADGSDGRSRALLPEKLAATAAMSSPAALPSSSSHLPSSLDVNRHAIVRTAAELNLTICFLLLKHNDLEKSKKRTKQQLREGHEDTASGR